MARKHIRARDTKMAKNTASKLNTLAKKTAKIYGKKTYTSFVVGSCRAEGKGVLGDRSYSFNTMKRNTPR